MAELGACTNMTIGSREQHKSS